MQLAEELGITDYPSPAGGCRLTEPGFARRMRELIARGEARPREVRLLGVGRHFRLPGGQKLVVGRNQRENGRVEALAGPRDCLMRARHLPGPTSMLRGDPDKAALRLAARITARYGKGRDAPRVRVDVWGARNEELAVAPAGDAELEPLRV
jgi:hypothetical protein